MKRILSFFFALVLSAIAFADPIADLLGRILPENGDAQRFSWSLSESDNDQFTLTCDGTTITVSGNNYVSIATGINWYLQHYAGIDISWNNPSDRLPSVLPACAPETHVCCADYVTTSTSAHIPIPWLSGAGSAGNRRSIGWLCTASTCP
ncbi:MAG: alpha-N-acetylglucosaminidase N-terminal domain-containing protein [Bacteroidaceae bacterium]|nr:alpha-N-acetylglucosaminidase N-terminal domain-containing protein [Bacteroidaceae bacterium]